MGIIPEPGRCERPGGRVQCRSRKAAVRCLFSLRLSRLLPRRVRGRD